MNLEKPLLSSELQIAYIEAGWHHDIVEQSRYSFIKHLEIQGIGSDQIDLIQVAGSLEIPLQCKLLAKTGHYRLIVAAGLIVDGGIYRHEFVASTVIDAMMQVQLETEVPILSVVLTPQHFSSDQLHQDFFQEHFKVKGEEAARACLQTLQNLNTLASLEAA